MNYSWRKIYQSHGSCGDMIGCRMLSKTESSCTSEDPQQWLQTTTIHKVFMLILETKQGDSMFKTTDPGQCQGERLLLNLYLHLCTYIYMCVCDCVCTLILLLYTAYVLFMSANDLLHVFPILQIMILDLLCHPRRPVHLPFLPHPRSQTCAWQQINQDGFKAAGVIQGKGRGW